MFNLKNVVFRRIVPLRILLHIPDISLSIMIAFKNFVRSEETTKKSLPRYFPLEFYTKISLQTSEAFLLIESSEDGK